MLYDCINDYFIELEFKKKNSLIGSAKFLWKMP